MAGRTDGLIKNFRASAAVGAYTIVKFGAADTDAAPASAAGDALIGTTGELGAALGERVDVHMGDIPEVRFGGNVTRGDPLTSDANGAAVTAAPGAGVKVRIIGFATVSGAAGDIGTYRYAPGVVTG